MREEYAVYEKKMGKSISVMEGEFAAIRAGRANPAVLDKVTVDYYGVPTPIAQMAGVSVPDARTLLIQPWDGSILKAIEKAILASDLGITPNNDGKVIRMAFPPLTEERRKEIVKSVHKLAEECKVAIRSIRRDAIDKFKAQKKAGELSEDDLKDLEKGIQKLTDTYCDKTEAAAKAKEKEIMEI
ncbi:ribosome recycling factor [Bittarella massiliensis (ex Durand et al. 2017)]|uniref:ribosome recycling factor n=1 Tax=Bittarella massiliensis (ex Durand et al. 2017) TaxID=1720313 RepID=UPI001AA165EA|nr:ribosome recycling factor [Bittarella massiliensis (ex Durand et al. 2017)]MBO1678409.1 ribosome recycling factor [Bittarella massiliensis (ex Durand et al. 2017)]